MTFKRELTRKSYAIEIPNDDFCALLEYEYDLSTINGCLFYKLDKQTNAIGIEYDGHFGNFVYLSLDTVDDCPAMWEIIDRIITEQIQEAIDYTEGE